MTRTRWSNRGTIIRIWTIKVENRDVSKSKCKIKGDTPNTDQWATSFFFNCASDTECTVIDYTASILLVLTLQQEDF